MSKRPLLLAAAVATTGLLGAAPAAFADSGAEVAVTAGATVWAMYNDDTGTFGLSIPASWEVSAAPSPFRIWSGTPSLVATAPDGSAELRISAFPLVEHELVEGDGGTFVGTSQDRPVTESEFTSNGGNLHGTRTDWPRFDGEWGESSILVDYQSHYSIYITLGSADQATLDLFDPIVGSFSPITTELPASVSELPTNAPSAPVENEVWDGFPFSEFWDVPNSAALRSAAAAAAAAAAPTATCWATASPTAGGPATCRLTTPPERCGSTCCASTTASRPRPSSPTAPPPL